jgi:hypothetical protein
MTPEHELLKRMGMTVQPLQGGCCGLAGSWGFENGKYDISLQCGEQALLPAVRSADPETVIVADGFSCKTQIEQAGTGRGALHVAQVLKLAREHGLDGHRGKFPERAYNHLRPSPGTRRRARRLATSGVSAIALAAVASVAVWRVATLGGAGERSREGTVPYGRRALRHGGRRWWPDWSHRRVPLGAA